MLTLFTIATPRAEARPRDREAPSQPSQLRVTSLSAYEVSLAWGASSDNSGALSYRVYISDGRELSVGQGMPHVRLSWGLSPATSYRFAVVAVDAAGNRSRSSNVVNVTLPPDLTPPTAPSLSSAYAGSDKVTLVWLASTDDGTSVSYEVLVDGRAALSNIAGTMASITNLTPDTAYVITVRARDRAGNWSTPSPDLTVRTTTEGASDVSPPSTPPQFVAFDDDCGDVLLAWNESLDDHSASADIRYDVYVNGTLQQSVIGRSWATLTIPELGLAQFELVAVDGAGNASAPALTALDVPGCDP